MNIFLEKKKRHYIIYIFINNDRVGCLDPSAPKSPHYCLGALDPSNTGNWIYNPQFPKRQCLPSSDICQSLAQQSHQSQHSVNPNQISFKLLDKRLNKIARKKQTEV